VLTTTLKKLMCVVCCGSNDEIKPLSGLSAADAEAMARRSTKRLLLLLLYCNRIDD